MDQSTQDFREDMQRLLDFICREGNFLDQRVVAEAIDTQVVMIVIRKEQERNAVPWQEQQPQELIHG